MTPVAKSTPIAYRESREEDRVFIVSSWLDSFRESHTAGMIAMADFYDLMWGQIEKLLDRPGARCVIACNVGDPNQLHGFIAFDRDTGRDPPVVFYVYTKAPFRRWGIARGLFAAAGIPPDGRFDYTHKTSVAVRLANKIPLARWQPMLARFPKGDGIRR